MAACYALLHCRVQDLKRHIVGIIFDRFFAHPEHLPILLRSFTPLEFCQLGLRAVPVEVVQALCELHQPLLPVVL